ncbi:Nucleic-acid-binding protein from mobile element jockey [Fusarium oxysporum f. sp. albedinis]|nr:Nucleic-acid-binding protein from mobile element jockey [Fusarium oxysporum f. sp. albedinis]
MHNKTRNGARNPPPPVTPTSPAKKASESLFQIPHSSIQVRSLLPRVNTSVSKVPTARLVFSSAPNESNPIKQAANKSGIADYQIPEI